MGAESIAMFQNAAYLVVALLVVATLYTIFSPLLEGNKLKNAWILFQMREKVCAPIVWRSLIKKQVCAAKAKASLKTWLISSALRNY